MEVIIENNHKLIRAAEGKRIHFIGSDDYFVETYVGDNVDLSMFEEVEDYPLYPEYVYEERVNQLIRKKYTESQEFSLLRQGSTTKSIEFNEYYQYCESCKELAKQQLEVEYTPTENEEEMLNTQNIE